MFGMHATTTGSGLSIFASAHSSSPRDAHAMYAELFPTGLHVLDSGTNGGMNAVASTSYTKTQWPWGTIPSNCQDVMVTGETQLCNPYDIEVYEIKYSDCPNQVPHRVCRCHNAQTDIDVWATQFG